MKNLVQDHTKSGVLDWTNAGSAVAAGDLVLVSAEVAAAAMVDIGNGASGSVLVKGRIKGAKATGGGSGWVIGTPLKVASNVISASAATEVVHGYAASAAADGDATAEIELLPMGYLPA